MYIDKYLEEDEITYIYDEITYQGAVEFIATGILNFCGCGRPGEALEHVRRALQQVDVKTTEKDYDAWKKETNELLGESAIYFTWYFLDNHGLTEHGTRVPGWLTESGKELLSDLNELAKNDYEL